MSAHTMTSAENAPLTKIIPKFVRFFFQRGAGEELGSTFFQCDRFSLVRVQTGRELMRLITSIGLNKISPKTLKNFHERLFDGEPSENVHF